MAKRRNSKKKSSKCPEPFNTLIDLAAAATLDYIAYKRRQKNGGKRGKIDPYAAAGFAIGTGHLNTTEDVIMLGGILGAMGAFDDDSNNYSMPHDNRYAWRLNCEDGSDYGVYPDDYETRNEFNAALSKEKCLWRDSCEDGSEYGISPEDFETENEYTEAIENTKADDNIPEDDAAISTDDRECSSSGSIQEDTGEDVEQIITSSIATNVSLFEEDDFYVFLYCLVKIVESQEIKYFRTEDKNIKKGDIVLVPSIGKSQALQGEVLSVERHMRFSAPTPVNETQVILRKQ